LRANGCPWDELTCSCAAAGGHLEVLKWAHENGGPWSAGTCAMAAQEGHLEVLRWLCANGCPIDVMTCNFAAEAGTSRCYVGFKIEDGLEIQGRY
jgi:hypothetical protein